MSNENEKELLSSILVDVLAENPSAILLSLTDLLLKYSSDPVAIGLIQLSGFILDLDCINVKGILFDSSLLMRLFDAVLSSCKASSGILKLMGSIEL
jgi:hypothetical protein